MLGSEPEGHGVFCLSSEVWERGLWSVRISSSSLRQGLLEGGGEALEIGNVRVSEKLLYSMRQHSSSLSVHKCLSCSCVPGPVLDEQETTLLLWNLHSKGEKR